MASVGARSHVCRARCVAVKPTYQTADGAVQLWLGDALDILPTLEPGSVDAVVTDPPYGMGNNGDTTRFTGGSCGIHRRGMGKVRPPIVGDDRPFDPSPWLDFPRVVLWGSNHYGARLPVGTTLVWLKRPDDLFGTFLSDAEVAWMKGGHGVYAFRQDWAGFSRIATDGNTLHQNQKPVRMMAWCLKRAKVPAGGLVLDPYMGVATTGIACIRTGRRFLGIEIDERYFNLARERIERELNRTPLFDPPTPVQGELV